MNLPYRSAQLFRAITAHPTPEELSLADRFLPSGLRPLFRRLPRAEQAHGLAVLRRLLAGGQHDPDLLAAALLHDLGKARLPLRLWERIVIVLAHELARRTALSWGEGPPSGWRRPFVVAACHPAWGAETVRLAGGSPMLVNLILRHQVESSAAEPAVEALLAPLRRADGDT